MGVSPIPSPLPFVSPPPQFAPPLQKASVWGCRAGPGQRIKIRVADGRLRRHTPSTHTPLCPPPSLPLPPVEASVPSTIQYCSRGGGREVAFGSVVSALQGENAAPLPPPLRLLRSATLMILILLLKTLMVFIVSF